jgi:hypothetical protein
MKKSKANNRKRAAAVAGAAPGSASEHQLTIIFPTEEAKRIFATWMSDGGGESDYFRSMEESETPSLRIGYHGPEDERYERNDKRRYGAFLADNTLRVEVCEDEMQNKP